ncbi:hypothetical protein ElyMa_005278400 [Elysia marginata]|uniref:Tectonic domain-containing protein n=1 Tax=Elysia marginata TaxID=1093978 RepID=A0AAV4JXV1_9GAST|nr:hypothetical protein ElyMa_005278400 [Elysia marginata]
MCLVYGDCCLDFHEHCGREVAIYQNKMHDRARAECVGSHTFLVANNDARGAEKSSNQIGQLRSIKAIIDYLTTYGPALTNTDTGHQYKSEEDFTLLNPDWELYLPHKFAYWTPTLLAEKHYDSPFFLDLMRNQSKPFGDNLTFIFEPSQKNARSCLAETVLICDERESFPTFIVKNLKTACAMIVDNATLLNASFSFKWRMESNVTEDDKPEPTTEPTIGTTKRKYNIASTTEYYKGTLGLQYTGMNTIFEPSCVISFRTPAQKNKFAFSYLLNIKEAGSISLESTQMLSPFKSITCNLNSQKSRESLGSKIKDSDAHDMLCPLNVTCQESLVSANGICAKPELMLLEVNALPGMDYQNLRLGVETLINSSNVLRIRDPLIWQDSSSCFSRHPQEIGLNTSSYFGLYYILRNSFPPTGKLPMLKELRKALAKVTANNQSLVDIFANTKLCAILANLDMDNFGLKVLREKGQDIDFLRDNYIHKQNLNTIVTKECKEIPWAWVENVFQDPFVVCEKVVPLIETLDFSKLNRIDLLCIKQGNCKKGKESVASSASLTPWVMLPTFLVVSKQVYTF